MGAAGLAVLLLAGGAVGCGAQGDGGKSSGKGGSVDAPAMVPAAAVAAAAKNADAITSMHYRMTGSFPGAGQIKAEAELGLKPLVMSMKMTSGAQAAQGPVEVRLVGKTMYVGGNAALSKETGGKNWLKLDMSALGANGLNTSQLGADQANQNPAAASTFLNGSKDIKKVGTETVDGVQTTHYKGTVTLDEIRAMAEKEGRTPRDTINKGIEQYSKLGVDSLNIDMWIDGENHTKQFRMRADAKQGPLDMTIVFLDINQPVKVTAPPAGDTADLSQMMKGLQQG
jgi:hypothetical protein